MKYPLYDDSDRVNGVHAYESVDAAIGGAGDDGWEITPEAASETACKTMAGQLVEMLGDAGEVDAAFFVDSWTYGLAAAVEQHRRRVAEIETSRVRDCGFAELGAARGWAWVQAPSQRVEECVAGSVAERRSYEAEWLRDGSERMDGHFAGPAQRVGVVVEEMRASWPMTLEAACQLLHVNAGGTDAEIKAAYRRLVSRWHPDLFATARDEEQARANECMVAINTAYHMLRDGAGNA